MNETISIVLLMSIAIGAIAGTTIALALPVRDPRDHRTKHHKAVLIFSTILIFAGIAMIIHSQTVTPPELFEEPRMPVPLPYERN